MKSTRFIILSILFLALSASAWAQTTLPVPKGGDTKYKGMGGTVSGAVGGSTKPIGTANDIKTYPVEYDRSKNDARLHELDKAMEERRWNSEDTAWEKACEIGTRAAFKKYIGMYPYGAHRGEADQKLIDLEVDDAFNHSHGDFPGMNRVEQDDDSPTSVVVVENCTDQMLTVYYSGLDSRTVRIAPGHKGTVTVKNGQYRIAASVPAVHVRPYAGTQTLEGGRYEVGFYIARSGGW